MAIRLLPRRLLGQTIRGVRTRLGLTEAELAESLGVEGGGKTVSRWERGEAQPDYGTLARLATMGVVDVLVFHEAGPGPDSPQLTPGEASELREILGRMELLLTQARQIAERAADRTAVEVLDAATGSRALPASEDATVALAAEVRVETRPRRTARAAGATKSVGSGGSTRSAGSTGSGASSGGSSRAGSSGGAAKSGRSGGGSSGGGRKSASGGVSSGTKRGGGVSGGRKSAAGEASGGGAGAGNS